MAKDSYNRNIDYMRISITDRCNLRCIYCMPSDVEHIKHDDILRFEEIEMIVKAGTLEGIKHLRITGGEPLVRKGCASLVSILKKIKGIETVTLTTNGILLKDNLRKLIDAGIDGINISIDTLDKERYRQITGSDKLDIVLDALYETIKNNIKTKVNVAVTSYTKEDDYINLANLARDNAVDVRFIEMMPIGTGKNFKTIDNRDILVAIRDQYPSIKPESADRSQIQRHGYGPAIYYKADGFNGSIGFISSIHDIFCDGCNRLRLTSEGYLKYCLCYEDGADLRHIVRSDDNKDMIVERLREEFIKALEKKPSHHNFIHKEDPRDTKPMSGIGG